MLVVGAGSNGQPQIRGFIAAGLTATTIAFGDVDADGDLDAAVTVASEYGGGGMLVALGNGDGTFQRSCPVHGGGASAAIADLDGDGRLDLIFADYYRDALIVALGNGDGTFGPTVHPVRGDARALLARDLDGDDLADLLALQSAGAGLSFFAGRGDGTLAPEASQPITDRTLDFAADDFDADGLTDLALVRSGTQAVSLLLGRGDGSFEPGLDPSVPGAGAGTAVATGDFDVDGNRDLLFTNAFGQFSYEESSEHWLLLGDGQGGFAPVSVFGFTYPSLVTRVAGATLSADFNGDGRSDLAVLEHRQDYIGGCLGQFAAQLEVFVLERTEILGLELYFFDRTAGPFTMCGYPGALAQGDFNRDGIFDLAASTLSEISVLLGAGDGTFTRDTRVERPESMPRCLATADLDSDAVQDLLFAGPAVMRGRGDGTFEPLQRYEGRGGRKVVSADFDRDGRPDAADLAVHFVECTPKRYCFSIGVSVHLNQGPFPTLSVPLDVKPGDDANVVLPGSDGALPAAILSTVSFDALDVDPESLRLSGAVVLSPGRGPLLCHTEEVSGDGLPKLLCQFDPAGIEVAPDEDRLIVEGRTFAGLSIRGEDRVRVLRARAATAAGA